MDSPPVALKVDAQVVVDGQPLRINVQVEGEGLAAQQVAAVLARAIAAALAQTTQLPTSEPSEHAAAGVAVQTEPDVTRSTSSPTVSPQTSAPTLERGAHEPMTSVTDASVSWLQRNRSRINLGFGGLLLALAVLVPIIAPPNQRSDMLIMTILFGLTGALLLFTAMLPGRGDAPLLTDANAKMTGFSNPERAFRQPVISERRRAESLRAPVRKQGRAVKVGWGLAMGVAFVVASLLAPFVLGAITADERFVIMLGFAPITVVGFFMIAIFGRSLIGKSPAPSWLARSEPLASKSGGAAAAKRPPVTRVPQNFEYRAIVPTAIGVLLVVMVIVVALVIYATVASMAR